MLKKRIVIATMVLALFCPVLSRATPLRWTPGPDLLGPLSQWWDLLPGVRHAPAARRGRETRKAGAGQDPNGSPACGQGTAPACGPNDH
jgi:hypothetical protein